jgi:hypothetical protein
MKSFNRKVRKERKEHLNTKKELGFNKKRYSVFCLCVPCALKRLKGAGGPKVYKKRYPH